jgi:hypothetical protein
LLLARAILAIFTRLYSFHVVWFQERKSSMFRLLRSLWNHDGPEERKEAGEKRGAVEMGEVVRELRSNPSFPPLTWTKTLDL